MMRSELDRSLENTEREIVLDHGVREFGHLTPRLREDLSFGLQHFRGTPSYILEDRLRSKFYRIGLPEYRFIALLDGNTSIESALASTSASLGRDALTINEAAIIVRWLIDNELAFTKASRDMEWLNQSREKQKKAGKIKLFNLMFIKLPLMNPDQALENIMPYFRWMTGGIFSILWFAVVVSGAFQIVDNWDRFRNDANGFFSTENWIWIIGIWTLLKIVHEFFHGLICKKYEGEVYEAGVIFILFAPIGYVDATSSWRFASRWQRIYTAFAGMYIEFFIAGIAAWIWMDSGPGLVNFLAWNVVVVASITTLLFNANPLMKFDGYYLFADYVDIPNLYGEGQQFVKHLFRRYMLGLNSRLPNRGFREQLIIGVYGCLSLLWRLLVVATLLIIASTLFHGAGIIIAVVSGILLIGVPVARFLRYLIIGDDNGRPQFIRFLLTAGSVVALCFYTLTTVEWSRSLNAPGIVDFENVQTVRNDSTGFVKDVFVLPGDFVQKGQTLIKLENNDLDIEIAELLLQEKRLEIETNIQILKGRQESVDVLSAQLKNVVDKKYDLQKLRNALQITSPIEGIVLNESLHHLKGDYLRRGEAIIEIGQINAKHAVVLLNQRDIESFRRQESRQIEFSIPGRGEARHLGTLLDVEPKATREISHPALTAIAGGPLGVQPKQDSSGYQFTNPKFEARISLPTKLQKNVYAGEIIKVHLESKKSPLSIYWYEFVRGWLSSIIPSSTA